MSAISGRADLTTDQATHLYTVPAGKCATVTVNLCNRSAGTRTVDVYIAPSSHTVADFIECGARLPSGGVLERTGLVMVAGERLFIKSRDGASVSARFHGFEEDA